MLGSVEKVRQELVVVQTSMAKGIWRRIYRKIVHIAFHAWRHQWAINRRLVAGLRKHRLAQGTRRWRANTKEAKRMRALMRKATAHFCARLLKKSLKTYHTNAKEQKRVRFLAKKTANWMRMRFIRSSFSKWRAEANEAAYQRAAAAASHAAVVATRAMKKMFYARDLAPAFRAWMHLHRRYLNARAALEAAGDFAARVFFLNAAVFARWRIATQTLRREHNEEAAEANRVRSLDLDDREGKLEHLLDGERRRGRAEKEGEIALMKMNEAAALRRSLVMERERRDAVAAVDAERAKTEQAGFLPPASNACIHACIRSFMHA